MFGLKLNHVCKLEGATGREVAIWNWSIEYLASHSMLSILAHQQQVSVKYKSKYNTNATKNTKKHESAFDNPTYKIATILFRPQNVKKRKFAISLKVENRDIY